MNSGYRLASSDNLSRIRRGTGRLLFWIEQEKNKPAVFSPSNRLFLKPKGNVPCVRGVNLPLRRNLRPGASHKMPYWLRKANAEWNSSWAPQVAVKLMRDRNATRFVTKRPHPKYMKRRCLVKARGGRAGLWHHDGAPQRVQRAQKVFLVGGEL